MAASTKTKRILDKESELEDGKLASLEPLAQPPKCPVCTSQRVWKDGLRYTKNGDVQRYLCRSCGYRFSQPNVKVNVRSQVSKRLEPHQDLTHNVVSSLNLPIEESVDSFSFQGSEDVGSHRRTVVGQRLNTFPNYSSTRRVCVTDKEGTKNLVQKAQTEDAIAGTSPKLPIQQIIELQQFALWLEKDGIRQNTIESYITDLKNLCKHGASLDNPESVKSVIGKEPLDNWGDSYKHRLCDVYSKYLEWTGSEWKKPQYDGEPKEKEFIPTEDELRIAINTGFHESVVYSRFLYETGARPNEADSLRWRRIDKERCVVDLPKSKHCNPRPLKVSKDLITMLFSLPKRYETVFKPLHPKTRSHCFSARMKRLARNTGNPRFNEVHLYTFRHCKALREYHKTRDIEHVKFVLGHKNIQTTHHYVQLYREVYGNLRPRDYVVKRVKNDDVEKAIELLKVGFTKADELGEFHLYRKPKVD